MKKRILSLFLVSIMVFSALPLSALAEIADDGKNATSLSAEATKDILDGAIYLPITIRDFNNDGMLFEYSSSSTSSASKWMLSESQKVNKPIITPSTDNQLDKGNSYASLTPANVLSRYYGDFYHNTTTAPQHTKVIYNADGSVTLRGDHNTNNTYDPQLHIDFKSQTKTTAYSYLAMVYKNAKNMSQWQLYPYGVASMGAREKKGSYSSGDTKLVMGSDEWNIVYFPIDNNEPMSGIRFDWTNIVDSEITIAGLYLVDTKADKYGYDDAADLLYAEGKTFSGSLFTSKAVSYAVFRYRNSNADTTATLKVGGANFGSKTLLSDSMWHWGFLASGAKSGSAYSIEFTNDVQISELYLLTGDEMAAMQKIFGTSSSGRLAGINPLVGKNDVSTSDIIVAKPYYDPNIDFVVSSADASDGYYTRYYAQRNDATLNLFDFISDSTVDCGSDDLGPAYPRYLQIRYRASDFDDNKELTFIFATNKNGGVEHQTGTSSSVTVDDDGKWHTLVVPLNESLDWYLGNISTTLPAGATLDIDYMNLFHNIAGAEYCLRDWAKLKAKYNQNEASFYTLNYTQSVFSLNIVTSPGKNVGGEFVKYFPFLEGSDAKSIQNKVNKSFNENLVQIKDSEGKVVVSTQSTPADGGSRGTWVKGLVENKLGPNGKPVYKKEVVEFVANCLALSLTVPYELPDGTRNYSALAGAPFDINALRKAMNNPKLELSEYIDLTVMNDDELFDMAEYLRHKIPLNGNSYDTYYYTVGTYDATKAKTDLSFKNVETCMDAAYLLLNNLWSSYDEGGYGLSLNDYTNIGLAYDEKTECHIFRSSYAGIDHNKNNRLLYNTVVGENAIEPWMLPAEGGSISSSAAYSEYRFLTGAIAQSGFGVTHSPYYFTDCNYANTTTMTRYNADPKATTKAGAQFLDSNLNVTTDKSKAQFEGMLYGEDNYNYTVQGSGAFIFDSTKDLFFEFNGDDDVYLYLNNALVLDLGGAHGRTDKRILITETLKNMGVKDGESVSFDFFQGERHGYGANFAILTNIPIINPNIEVDKSAQQINNTPDTKDDALEYNATVNPDAPISYNFELVNTADNDEHLYNYSFKDSKIGVELSKDIIKLGNHTDINDLTVTIVYGDSKVTYSKDTTDWSEDMLKQILSGDILREHKGIDPANPYRGRGLFFEESITISGFKYEFTADDKKEGYFQNTVVVSTESVDMMGIAEGLVKQDDFVVILPNDKIYLWADHEREFNVSEFFIDEHIGKVPYVNIGETVEDISYAAAVTSVSEADDGLTVSCSAGADIKNQIFKVNSSKTGLLTFKYTVQLTITDTKAEAGTEPTVENMTYTVAVYVYDANDTSFVLDYGLPIVVKSDDYLKGDTLQLKSNISASSKVLGYATTNDVNPPKSEMYGKIREIGVNGDITYTPDKFIEGRDYVYVKIGVSEDFKNQNPYSVTKGVEMWKKVSFVPASVVYYEENIGGVEYKYNSTVVKKLDDVDRIQSADGELQYGYDNAYNDNNATQSGSSNVVPSQYYIIWYKEVIKAGEGGYDNQGNTYNFSNNSYAYINTKSDDYQSFWAAQNNNKLNPAMEFTFNGTGFEIISYTNLNTATVVVEVFDDTGAKLFTKYVFTKYTNGQLQQVPIIDFEGLTYGTYSVKVYAVPAYESTATDFYLDGIRIFDPLGKGNNGDPTLREETYLEKENNADIFDIRELLLKSNKVALAGTKIDANKTAYSFLGNGTTLVERKGKGPGMIGEGYLSQSITDADDIFNYATVGPNNEIYLSAGNTVAVLLKEKDAASAKTFQVEAKRLGEKNSLLAYVVIDGTGNYSYRLAEVKSYTAMYFEIDVTACPTDANGNYVVIIGTALDEELKFDGTISLTSFKVKGYDMSAPDISVKTTTANSTVMSEFAEIVMEGTEVLSGHTAKYNPDLYITSVTSSVSATVGGKVKFNVVASAEASDIIVRDGNGELVDSTVLSARTIGNKKVFTVEMDAPANVGTYNYAVVAQDSEGRLSEEAHFTATAIN